MYFIHMCIIPLIDVCLYLISVGQPMVGETSDPNEVGEIASTVN